MAALPAADIAAMPKDLRVAVSNFLGALALEAGSAIEAGRTPPGRPLDDVGLRYGIVVYDEPVLVEYLALRDVRQLRVSTMVWMH